ncbi:energy-coupling factor transporter ATPase [Desulfuribacillus stibiiarsenatis]|uniref:Energy-coupling factor transporter ATPase n=1 Tax=Desulfuribacillus stibiiarsenatis TaxID=1390249 RepID=A0A1E5L8A4_9FIRM|nr:energy-coupling factor transporter ATPase [Desulfuribacillus stibiiarsenatis]OEH86356.1 energy-coupling factor transporter ATPase [Desulfuribacillus stibiiarsenatis]
MLKTAYIQAHQVVFYYGEGVTSAIEDVSLSIEKGTHIVILGANGSGKSTLARHFNALLAPKSGNIQVGAYDTSVPEHIWSIRKAVGMVFQNPENQIVAATVEDDIVFGMENLGLSREVMQARLEKVLAMFDLESLRKKEPYQLSGGQKQRVAIAGVIAMEPDVIIFDEATSMLDYEGRREVQSSIKTLLQEQTATVIRITHDMEEAVDCDRIYVMHQGRVVLQGSPSEVFQSDHSIDSYHLELPFAIRMNKELNMFEDMTLTFDELVMQLCK